MKTVTEKLRINHKRYSAMTRLRVWDRNFFQHQSWLNQGNGRGMNRKELQSPPSGASLPQGDPCPNPVCTPPRFSLSPRSAFSTAVMYACNSSATPWSNVHYRTRYMYKTVSVSLARGYSFPKLSFQSLRVCFQEYAAPQFHYQLALHSCSPGITAAKSVNKKS